MGDFIIITLMVSSFWLLWEIIRVVSMEWLNRDEITLPAGELGRSELLRCADSFEQLSGMFQGMVTKKEELSGQDMDEVLFRVQTSVCRSCSAVAQCWDYGSETGICRFNRIAESIIQGKELNNGRKEALQKQCLHGDFFFEAVADQIEKARMDMLWHNRLMESRSAAADQLHETACIIRKAAGHICDVRRVDGSIRQQADIRLRMHGMILKDIWCIRQPRNIQLYVTLRTAKKGRCIRTKEVAGLLSAAFGTRLMPDEQGKTVVNYEYSTILFYTEPQYYMTGGVARIARDGEVISGDNFSLFPAADGIREMRHMSKSWHSCRTRSMQKKPARRTLLIWKLICRQMSMRSRLPRTSLVWSMKMRLFLNQKRTKEKGERQRDKLPFFFVENFFWRRTAFDKIFRNHSLY